MQKYGDEISVWTVDGALVRTFSRHEGEGPQGGQCLAFMPDGKTLLAPAPTDNPEHRKFGLGLWDAESGALQRLIPGPNPDSDDRKLPLDNSAGICTLSPDGTLVAMRPRYPISPIAVYATRDRRILGVRKLWLRDIPVRFPDGKLLPDLQNSPSALAFGDDNSLLVGAGVAIVTFGAPFGSREPNYIAMTPTGDLKLLGAPSDISYDLWNIDFTSVKYSSAGNLLAIGTSLLGRDAKVQQAAGDVERLRKLASVKIWDVRAQRVVAEDPMPDDRPSDMDWDRDGTLLAVVTQNHFLKIYRPAETGGAPILQVHLDGPSESVRFSPAADQVLVGPGRTIQVYTISRH